MVRYLHKTWLKSFYKKFMQCYIYYIYFRNFTSSHAKGMYVRFKQILFRTNADILCICEAKKKIIIHQKQQFNLQIANNRYSFLMISSNKLYYLIRTYILLRIIRQIHKQQILVISNTLIKSYTKYYTTSIGLPYKHKLTLTIRAH